MDTVTLTFVEVLMFVNWSESNYKKNGQKGVVNKLIGMGMMDIRINGRGKKAAYTFNIPYSFWRLLMVTDKCSAINIDCMNSIIDGNVTADGLILFDRQLIEKIAIKHDKEYNAVNSAFKRIKHHLAECRLIGEGRKLHRVKFKEGGKWIDGKLAFDKDKEARDLWKRFYENCLKAYQKTDPTAKYVPKFLSKEFEAAYINKMKHLMNVYAYKIVHEIVIDYRLTRDIEWARANFLSSLNLNAVRIEIATRQAAYRQENTAPILTETVRNGLTKEQRNQAYKDLKNAFEKNLI